MILLMQDVTRVIQENFAILAPLFIIQLLLMIVALISLAKVEAANGPKWMWAIIIIFINIIGPIIYFIFGKRDY
ncbi:PLDc N-terminal domain-containing protein [Halobacillus naozhouensis]|uniref:PLDc N-terminal domain-containing protein n=1 Tax=Halobacillus naozhouensis TaxID=554880 RepID=A0ABY8J040_9BACI|nr:PLDc N-terminal domain-containing protein [Halobacillus naozhouensis]WFT75855.1 PLDc N-terminal domain-containing protein [Halobacillus naozhouensis]